MPSLHVQLSTVGLVPERNAYAHQTRNHPINSGSGTQQLAEDRPCGFPTVCAAASSYPTTMSSAG